MKRNLLAAVVALCLVLTGCSSMLERDYVSATRHVEYHAEDNASVVQAESYQGLVSALLYFVTSHSESGVIHLSNYTGDVAQDLEKACKEILEEDPIGVYALDDIEHEFARIVSYYEVRLSFVYEHTADEVRAIWATTSTQEMLRKAEAALDNLKDYFACNVYYLNRDKAELLTEMRQIWLNNPLVLAEPGIRVKLYPENGINQVVEFTFDWSEDTDDLSARGSITLAAAKRMLEEIPTAAEGEKPTALQLADALLRRSPVEGENGDNAYDALVKGSAHPRSVTMALKLLCDLAELDTTVVEGRLNGESRWWLIVKDGDFHRHLEPNGEQLEFTSDEQMRALGYEWSSERYPVCETPPEEEQTSEGDAVSEGQAEETEHADPAQRENEPVSGEETEEKKR